MADAGRAHIVVTDFFNFKVADCNRSLLNLIVLQLQKCGKGKDDLTPSELQSCVNMVNDKVQAELSASCKTD